MKKIFTSKNKASGLEGVCLAMSMDWIMQSLRARMDKTNRKFYLDRDENLTRHHIGPVQKKYLGSFFFDVKKMAWYFKLKVEEKISFTGSSNTEKAITLVSRNPMYMFLLLTDEHAMAAAYVFDGLNNKHEYLFFDPNGGLYSYDNAGGYINAVQSAVKHTYKSKKVTLCSMGL